MEISDLFDVIAANSGHSDLKDYYTYIRDPNKLPLIRRTKVANDFRKFFRTQFNREQDLAVQICTEIDRRFIPNGVQQWVNLPPDPDFEVDISGRYRGNSSSYSKVIIQNFYPNYSVIANPCPGSSPEWVARGKFIGVKVFKGTYQKEGMKGYLLLTPANRFSPSQGKCAYLCGTQNCEDGTVHRIALERRG